MLLAHDYVRLNQHLERATGLLRSSDKWHRRIVAGCCPELACWFLRREENCVKIAFWVLLTTLVSVPCGFAQSAGAELPEPEANPGRPTVSTPATLTPVGYLQFETGSLGAADSPEFSSRFGINEVIKLSVARRLELLTSVEPFVHSVAGGRSANRPDAVSLGAQAVLR